MVDAYGGKVGHWRAHVAAWITGEGQDYANIHCEVRFQAVDSWDYSSLNGNYGASVAGQTNRGSSSMGISVGVNGEKTLVGKDLRISKGRGGQNVSFDGYVNITGYASGGSSAGGSIYIGGRPSHTITYNANGGGGAPGNQTKWYGESLFLSNDRPTRALYEFQGWSLTQGSSNVDYRPGQQWFPDEDRTLYAVWRLSIVAPTISSWTVLRCDSDGNQSDTGTYAKVTCQWSVDTKADTNNKGVSIKVTRDGTADDNSISGTSGTFTKVYSGVDAGMTHSFIATLRDTHLTVSASTFLGPVRFLLDISPNGKGLGIGQAAPVSAVAIGGMFFANSLDELPSTPADVGGIDTPVMVLGKRLAWTGSSWATPTSRYWRAKGTRSDGQLVVNNGDTDLTFSIDKDDNSGLKIRNIASGNLIYGVTGDYDISATATIDGGPCWMMFGYNCIGNTIPIDTSGAEINKGSGFGMVTLRSRVRFNSSGSDSGIQLKMVSNSPQTMREKVTLTIMACIQ